MTGTFNVSYQAGGRFDFPFFPTKTKPFIKGRRLYVAGSNVYDEYTVPQDMEFMTMSIGCSRYQDTDYWSLSINGEVYMESVYTKDVPEGFFFMVVTPVKTGDVIRLDYENRSGSSKVAWFNYQFLR